MNDCTEERALFRQALVEARLRKSRRLIDAHDGEVVFTERHERIMKRMLQNADKPVLVFGKKHRKRIVALLVAAAILLLSGMTVYANKDRIISFVEEIFDGYTAMFFESDDESDLPLTVEQKYKLTYVPEGYVQTGENINDAIVWIQWMNTDDELIIFSQAVVGNVVHNMDNEQSSNDWIVIGEYDVHRTVNENGWVLYIWTDEVYDYTIDCGSHITLEEIEKMINSMALIE